MVTAENILFNDDGTAWWVTADPIASSEGWAMTIDRPCDYDSCHDGWIDTQRGNETEHCKHCNGTGRHTFTIEVECRVCGGNGAVDHLFGAVCTGCSVFPYGITGPMRSTGRQTFRMSVIPGMVLPIYAERDTENMPHHDHVVLYPSGNAEWMTWEPMDDDYHYEHIALPPASKSGIWAVKLKVQA